ncbi:MAG TPA: radical SAM protein [Kofleriaceae bacterium]
MSVAPLDRLRFREHPLDGAMLYFQPARGVHVRVQVPATAAHRRRAPRVAMFGITNVCNLACAFCSRDAARPSAWTVDTAAAALRGLDAAGTLEVAYGGGEPFAFRGFAELVAEVHATTALAQHVTTNGALIRPATWSRFAGRLGQVRISIYDGIDWRAAAATLAMHGQRWGANRIVDPAALATLPALLAELAAHGCDDVSLLAYVGPDAAHHLDAAGDARLAAIVEDSPLPCRISVCFGARVPVPQLRGGGPRDGDCGAGRDFVSITPDRRVQGCSFQDGGLPGTTSDEILAAWRLHQAELGQPAMRRGCARILPRAAPDDPAPPIAIWQAFSGNNSGECLLVARFAAVADAEAYLAALLPEWRANTAYPPAWRALFAAEGVALEAGVAIVSPSDAGTTPRELIAIGRSVIATQHDATDAFPQLRALAWKRGAFVVPGGVHAHGPVWLLAAIRAAGPADRDRVLAAPRHDLVACQAHGDLVIAAVPTLVGERALETVAEARDVLVRLAGDRPLAAELCFHDESEVEDEDDGHTDPVQLIDDAITAALQRLGHREPEACRLWIRFWREDAAADAAAFAAHVPGDRTVRAGPTLLIDPAADRKRLAVQALRHGGDTQALDGPVRITAIVWHEDLPDQRRARRPRIRPIDAVALEAGLRRRLGRHGELTVEPPPYRGSRQAPILTITTLAPREAVAALAAQAHELGARVDAWAAAADPIGAAVRRVIDDVRS